MAACGGGCSSNVRPTAGALCHAPQSRISAKRLQYLVGSGVSLRAAIGEHGLRRRPWRWAVTWRSAGERPEGRARVAGTHRPNGATAAINPDRSRSPLNAVSGWKLGLLITDFARFINSEIALLCGRQGAATHGDLLVGSGGTHEEIARLLEGGFVGRALLFVPSARPSNRSIPPRAIALWGLGPLHEQIARSHEGGLVGHALGAKRVALGPLSRGRYGLGRGPPHDGVGVPAPGFATIDLACGFLAVTMHPRGPAGRCTHSSRATFLPPQRQMLRCSSVSLSPTAWSTQTSALAER